MSLESHYVYVISEIKGGSPVAPCKIGISKNPSGRLATLQTGSPLALGLVACIALPNSGVAAEVEQAMHQHLANTRLKGEWFSTDPLEAVMSLCVCVIALFEETISDEGILEQALAFSGVAENFVNADRALGSRGWK